MKVAVYVRLSKEDLVKKGDESESIQNQKSLLINYALEREWDIFKIYSDEDYTGSDKDRPEFNQLLADARNRKFNVVLCKSQSRFTRDMEMVERLIHYEFLELGIRFVSIVDNADTEVKGNKKARQINGLVNEWYLEDLSDSIKVVFRDKQKKGQFLGSFATFGYKRDSEQKGRIVIDEEAAPTVKLIFDLYLAGKGVTAIARHLNQHNILNATALKQKQQVHFVNAKPTAKSTYWNSATVAAVLRNQMYIGNMVQNRFNKLSYKSKKLVRVPKDQWIIVEGTHEPILDRETFNRVNEMLDSKAKIRSSATGEVHIFAGRVRCKECGQMLKMGRYKVKEGRRSYLKCTGQIIMKNCEGCTIAYEELERFVLEQVNRLNDQYFSEDEIEKRVKDGIDNDERALNTYLHQCEKEKGKLVDFVKTLKTLYMDKIKGVISEEEFVDLKDAISADKVKQEDIVETLENDIARIRKRRNEQKSKIHVIRQYQNLGSLSRQIVTELIDVIHIGHKNKVTKERTIEISWNF